MAKRDDYLSWDEYYMSIAIIASMRSKDESTQVGACLVDKNKRLLTIGYNGTPIGWNDDFFPWEREGERLNTKYPYVCHAERNAIDNFRGNHESIEGATLYVNLFPCNECAKSIIQSGIRNVIYLSDKYAENEDTKAAKRMFDMCRVTYRQIDIPKTITINLSESQGKNKVKRLN